MFYEGIEWAGEEPLVPTYVVSFSGCNMSCDFCLTGRESQDGRAGALLDPEAIGSRILAAARELKSVTVLGGEPTIHLGGALQIAARVPSELAVVWKTNAYASPEGLALLGGIPDVVLADYKFGNDACALRLAAVPDYSRIVRDNLRWARRASRLIVRHLVMPGHFDCCLVPVAGWLAAEMPQVPVSLMDGFLPVFRSARHAELGRTNRPAEADRARRAILDLGLKLVPWTMCPAPCARATSRPDQIWIDRNGRISVDSASAELVTFLKDWTP